MMMLIGNAFKKKGDGESEGNGPEDKAEAKGVTITMSRKDAQKVMDYCDMKGISYSEDTE